MHNAPQGTFMDEWVRALVILGKLSSQIWRKCKFETNSQFGANSRSHNQNHNGNWHWLLFKIYVGMLSNYIQIFNSSSC